MSMTHDEMIAVIQAHKDGLQIEFRLSPNDIWKSAISPNWNFSEFEYRVKPEPPKPREWWFIKSIGPDSNRYGWMPCDVYQQGVGYLEQVHVREVLPEEV